MTGTSGKTLLEILCGPADSRIRADAVRDATARLAVAHRNSPPHDVAVHLSRTADPDLVDALIRVAVVDWVATVLTATRTQRAPLTGATRPTAPARPPSPSRPPTTSRTSLTRDWWMRTLAAHVHLDGELTKPLGDCTVRDLEVAAAHRFRIASDLNGGANALLKLAETVADRGKSTVAGLAESDLRAAVGNGALKELTT